MFIELFDKSGCLVKPMLTKDDPFTRGTSEHYEMVDINTVQTLIHSGYLREDFTTKCDETCECNKSSYSTMLSLKYKYENEKAQQTCYSKRGIYIKFEGKKIHVFKVSYKHSDGISYGRVFPFRSLGVTTFRRKVRNTYLYKTYMDFDMKRAHPKLLKYVCSKIGIKTPWLDIFLEKYEEFMKQAIDHYKVSRDCVKRLFLSLFFGGSLKSWMLSHKHIAIKSDDGNINYLIKKDDFCDGLSKELKMIAKKLSVSNKELFDEVVKRKEENIYGSFLSYYLQTLEYRIVSWVVMHGLPSAIDTRFVIYQYDGFQIPKMFIERSGVTNDEMCLLIKKAIKDRFDMDCDWTVKPLDDDIYDLSGFKLPSECESEVTSTEVSVVMKQDANRGGDFILKSIANNKLDCDLLLSNIVGRSLLMSDIDRLKVALAQCNAVFYDKDQRYIIYSNGCWGFLKSKKETRFKSTEFIYISDFEEVDKRSGKKKVVQKKVLLTDIWDEIIGSIPSINNQVFNPNIPEGINGKTLNLCNGYLFGTVENCLDEYPDVEYDDPDIHKILYFIKEQLCGGDEYSFKYVCTFLSYIVRGLKAESILIFQSVAQRSIGKSFFWAEMMKRYILGDTYVQGIKNISEMTQRFNGIFKDKSLIVGNEIFEGSRKETESLKEWTTSTSWTIEEKGLNPYNIPCICNAVFSLNKGNPIHIAENDRRFAYIDTKLVAPSNPEENKKWFDEVEDCFRSNENVKKLVSFWVKFGTCNITTIPQTKTRNDQVNMNKDPVAQWFDEIDMDLEQAQAKPDEMFFNHRRTLEESFSSYKSWCQSNNIECRFTTSAKFSSEFKTIIKTSKYEVVFCGDDASKWSKKDEFNKRIQPRSFQIDYTKKKMA